MLSLEAVAALTHELRSGTPTSTVGTKQLAELLATACAADAKAGSVAASLCRIFGDGSGEMVPAVLACGAGLLSDTSPSERLKLAFHGCDNDSVGFLSLPQLSQFVKAFTCIFVAAVEAMVGAAMSALRVPEGSDLRAALMHGVISPAMKASVASLSRSAKELWCPHGINALDFQSWALAHHSVAFWTNRLSSAWSSRLLGLPFVGSTRPDDDVMRLIAAAGPSLSPSGAASLLAEAFPKFNNVALSERLFVLHAAEGAQQVELNFACASLVILMGEKIGGAKALENIHELQKLGADVQASPGADILQLMTNISRDLANSVLVCCSLFVVGKPRSAITRQIAVERMDDAKTLSEDALKSWIEVLQQFWPAQCQLLASRTVRAALRTQRMRRGGTEQQDAPQWASDLPNNEVAAEKIQAAARGKLARNAMESRKYNATIVQTLWRMVKARGRLRALKLARQQEDKWDAERRSRISRLRSNEAELLAIKQVPAQAIRGWSLARRTDAAIRIQSAVRALRARQELPCKRLARRQEDAAKLIQVHARLRMEGPSDKLGQARKHRPRLIAHMSDEEIARWQNVIHSKRRVPGAHESLWSRRASIQESLERRALQRMEREQAKERRKQLILAIPAYVLDHATDQWTHALLCYSCIVHPLSHFALFPRHTSQLMDYGDGSGLTP